MTALSEKGEVVFRSPYIWALSAVLFGLLYIPAFMYGFFWLWIAPFTAVIIFFLRAMIDDAIARVAKKGDAAVQAKAMIPEFIKMNIVMTVLLSLPFVSALWLNHAGYIQVIQQSAADQELWRFCLWILKRFTYEKVVKMAEVQIFLSNMFFLIFLIFFILFTSSKVLKQQLFIILHKNSYKFLRSADKPNDLISKGGTLIVIIFLYIFYSSYQGVLEYFIFYKPVSLLESGVKLIQASFLAILLVILPIGLYVQSKIRGI